MTLISQLRSKWLCLKWICIHFDALIVGCCASGHNVQLTACFLSVCWFIPTVPRCVWTNSENNGWYILVINYISIGGREELRWSLAIYVNNLSFRCRSVCSIRLSVQNNSERRRCVYHQTNNYNYTSEVDRSQQHPLRVWCCESVRRQRSVFTN